MLITFWDNTINSDDDKNIRSKVAVSPSLISQIH